MRTLETCPWNLSLQNHGTMKTNFHGWDAMDARFWLTILGVPQNSFFFGFLGVFM